MVKEHPQTVLEALKRYDTPTLANAIETFDVRPWDTGFMSWEVRSLFPELPPMVGYAATCTMRARGVHASRPDQTELWQHVLAQPAPRVMCVQDLDDPPGHGAMWGEVMATIFQALGCAGVVTDGCVRDLNEARQMGFNFFARAACVSHAYMRVEEVGGPVTIGGMTVNPGDLIHADQHGVLLVPHEVAADLPAAADRVVAREEVLIKWVRSDDFSAEKLGERRRVKH
jgi:regulator of RNase E activity RraA